MRSSWMLALALVGGCSTESPPKESVRKVTGDSATQKPAQKLPPPDKPLPGLAPDPGGGTGKPLWGVGIGGLGSDAPRAIAVDSKGDVVVVGNFDGELDLGALGKRTASGG